MKKNHKFSIFILFILFPGLVWIFFSFGKSDRSIELKYNVTVKDIPNKANKIAVWIPIPRSNSVQHLEKLYLLNDLPYTILTDKVYGNRFIYTELDKNKIQNSEISLTAFFRVYRKRYKRRKLNDDVYQNIEDALKRFLTFDRLVPINGEIKKEANSVTKGVTDPFLQAKHLFNHIVNTIEYDKSGVGWGRGDALYACDVRAGNCTDFHSLFIGEVRSLKIPARFIMGFPLPSKLKEGSIPGYHCWAEFYIKGKGWIPLDASEAKKHLDNKEEYFENLDSNRIAFTIGRDIRLPLAHSEPRNYVIYPYAEIDEKETPVKWTLSFENL